MNTYFEFDLNEEKVKMKKIAVIRTDFKEKFGIPRQSGLVPELIGKIYFEPEYRNPDALKGLEEFNYIWLIWEFSETKREDFRASVRPPRLGGNSHIGVFATRAPYRPNPIGLSCVRLLDISETDDGPVLTVGGADILDKTAIYDIKPYIPYTDMKPDAAEGFTSRTKLHKLDVVIPDEILKKIPKDKRKALISVLAEDPRPSYQSKDTDRVYGMVFSDFEVKFKVSENVLTVISLLL